MENASEARSSVSRRWLHTLVAGLTVFGLLIVVVAHAATYIYDANGRLRAVTSSTGASSEYIYDALGNLYAIDSISSAQLAIFAFTPNHGPVGLPVTIIGQGFSTTPASNAVTFNGTAATVTSATATLLTVAVPSGATTGPIAVQVGSNVATSVDNFTVTGDPGGQPPTIASFSPAIATAGTSITVLGNAFVTTAGPTFAGVNDYTAAVTPTSNTQLSFSVASQTGSGPVTVTTPYGLAQSAQPLIVVPTSVGASNVIATANLSINGAAQTLNISTASKYGVAIFQGTTGQWLSLQCSSLTTTASSVAVTVYDSNGTTIISSSISATAMSVHLPPLPHSGTYTVVLSPGSVTAQVALGIESNLAMGSTTSATVATTVTGQSKRLIFNAVTGDNFGMGMTGVSTAPTGGGVVATAYAAGGAQVNSATCGLPGYGSCSASLRGLTVGTYGVVLQPYNSVTHTFSVTFWLTHDAAGTLLVGTPITISTTNPGQNATYAFQGTAGQQLQLAFDPVTLGTGISYVYVNILDPTGACAFASGTSCPTSLTSKTYQGLVTLPSTGTYTVKIIPVDGGSNSGTVSMGLTLSQTGTAALTLDSATGTTISTSLEGQQQQLTFSVTTAGDNLGLGMTNLSTTPTGGGVSANVYNASGASVGSGANCGYPGYGSCSMALRNLAVGTYTIVLKPWDTRTKTFNETLWLSHDVTSTMAIGTPTTIATTNPGQNATYTFLGTAGQQLQLALDPVTLSAGITSANISILNPAGTCAFPSGTSCPISVTGKIYQGLATLPTTGTYTVKVIPVDGGSKSGTVSIGFTLSQTTTSTLPLDVVGGTAVSTTVEGQQQQLTFSVTSAGDNLGLGMTNTSTTPTSGAITATVYSASGTQINNANGGICGVPGSYVCAASLRGLAVGTYTIVLKPYSTSTKTFSATLWLNHDVTGTLTTGTPTTIATTVPGQNATYTFSGTASHTPTLSFSSASVGSGGAYLNAYVYNPAGTNIASSTSITSSATLPFTMSTTGTYSLYIHPVDLGSIATTGSVQVTLTGN